MLANIVLAHQLLHDLARHFGYRSGASNVAVGSRQDVLQVAPFERVARLSAPDRVLVERRRDPFTHDAEEKLSRRLQAKVRIVRRRRGGRIEIGFGSEEELIGLYERLSGK